MTFLNDKCVYRLNFIKCRTFGFVILGLPPASAWCRRLWRAGDPRIHDQ